MTIKYFFLVLLLLNICFGLNLRQKLNDAITKAKNIYKHQFGKDKSWHFLGYDMSEYPGTNKEMKKIQADKWEEYYSCLRKQDADIGEHGSIIPEAVLAFEGESITFICKVCISPAEANDIEMVEWFWNNEKQEFLEPVDYTEHILLSPEDKTLHIYNLGADHTGQYVCKLGSQLTAPYFLTVVNNSEPLSTVHPKTALKGPYAQKPWKIHPDVMLDTMWTKWSPCSTCDVIGRRHKYGHCTIIQVSNIENNDMTEANNITTFETNANNNTQDIEIVENDEDFIDLTNSSVHLSKLDKEFLKVFKFGIPCRSHILPTTIKNIQVIRERQSEIMVGYCKVKCPEDEIFAVKDKNGNIIETANNSAGIYSTLQGLPPLEPDVERRLQFEDAEKNIALTCPGNLNSDTPIQWQIGSKNVIAELLQKESGGRLYISITDKIHIQKARVSDSNIYSCWQNKKLAGTIRLVVEKQIKLNFNHHIMLIGTILIVATFLYVYIRVFFGRKYAKI